MHLLEHALTFQVTRVQMATYVAQFAMYITDIMAASP